MPRLKRTVSLITLLLGGLLTGCASHVGTEDLDDLQYLSTSTVKQGTAGVTAIRSQALQETAMTLGAQAGLAAHAKEINISLEQKDPYLRKIFNFNALLLAHSVLPPVLLESRGNTNLSSDESIRVAERTYKILHQAKFVTTAPNWREYLKLSFTQPEVPNVTLLPKNKKERKLWRKYTRIGWEEGGKQAEAIFQENLARIKRDYTGMILYRKLLIQRIVSAPFVAKTQLCVTRSSRP